MSRFNLDKQIKKYRSKLKLSQDQLARKAGIPFSTLAKIEAGYTPNPSIETVASIAEALEISLDKMIGKS
jgi:transcriptional regulator with XRE-family HTH domain